MTLLFQSPLKKKQYLLLAVDGILVLFSICLSYVFRNSLSLNANLLWEFLEQLPWLTGVAIVTQILTLYVFELYELGKPFYFFKTLTKISLAVAVNVLLLSVLFYWSPAYRIGRGVMAIQIPFTIGLLFAWRLLFERGLKPLHRIHRVLLIGVDESIAALLQELDAYPVKAYHVVGILNGMPCDSAEKIGKTPVLDGGSLKLIAKRNYIDTVVFSLDSLSKEEQLLKEGLALKYEGVKVYDLPTFYKQLTGKVPVFQVNGSWLLLSPGVGAFAQSSSYAKMKRVIDILLSLCGLILSSPLLLLTAVAIKLDSKGPIFFKQKRMGLAGREFAVVKFRTMIKNAEAKTGPRWADEDDPRITRIGSFLRRTRVDELPQLYNVLKGDMSFVGPRPIRKYFEEQAAAETPFYHLRHSVKPGLTGWAQTRHHSARSKEGPLERFQYDLFYIQESSLFLDFLIFLKTIQTILCKPSQ